MNQHPDNRPLVSVIIPTRGRAAALAAHLGCLCRQQPGTPRFEVVVALDGPDAESARTAAVFAGALDVRVIECPRHGIAEVKNAAIASSRGQWLLLTNDDVLPAPHWIAAHVHAHANPGVSGPAMVLGWSPFAPRADDRVFDRLVRETSLIFFWDQMIDERGTVKKPSGYDWGFRHAWNLNLSVSREAVLGVGGFRPAIANCCYEDVELAHRLSRKRGMRVLFRPGALAVHEHRYTPEAYFAREFRLGYSAYGLAYSAPECAREVFGRDVLSEDELHYARLSLVREAGQEKAMMARFLRVCGHRAGVLDTPAGDDLRDAVHALQLPLKRLAWRRGLVAAFEQRAIEGLFHPRNGLETEPCLRAPMGERGAREGEQSPSGANREAKSHGKT